MRKKKKNERTKASKVLGVLTPAMHTKQFLFMLSKKTPVLFIPSFNIRLDKRLWYTQSLKSQPKTQDERTPKKFRYRVPFVVLNSRSRSMHTILSPKSQNFFTFLNNFKNTMEIYYGLKIRKVYPKMWIFAVKTIQETATDPCTSFFLVLQGVTRRNAQQIKGQLIFT